VLPKKSRKHTKALRRCSKKHPPPSCAISSPHDRSHGIGLVLVLLASRYIVLIYKATLVPSVVLIAVLYFMLVAVGRPYRYLRWPTSLSSHFSSLHTRPPCWAGTTYVLLYIPNSNKFGLSTKLHKRIARLMRIRGRARPTYSHVKRSRARAKRSTPR
jgi:hypothetical protein